MPIGYQRGNTYHIHYGGDEWMNLPIFTLLTKYAMARKFGVHVSWTHITRAYDVELREIVYFKSSGHPYMMPRANRGGKNPLEALVNVLRETMEPTPYLSALLLEAECILLTKAHARAVDIGERVEKLCEELQDAIFLTHGLIMRREMQVLRSESEWDRSKEIIPKSDVARVIAPIIGQPKPIPAAPDEDDDL
jgi:hypothetical protein